MIACYDLARCPPTFDAVAFLALAELERQRRGEEFLDIVVLPGPCGGFRRDSHWPYDVAGRQQMRDNVLVPLCRLLPSVRSVEVADDRSAEGWGKGEYHVGLPAIVQALKANCRPLRFYLDGKPLRPLQGNRLPKQLVFTLREASHYPLRNSRVDEWLAAARELAGRGFWVLIIRDALRMGESFPAKDNVVVFKAWTDKFGAAQYLPMRAHYYARSVLNVGISNGPMWMSIFMNAPTLMLRPTTNAAEGCYDDAFFAKYGVSRGSQLPNSLSHQRLVWEEDNYANIVRAVEEFVADADDVA